jgi:hypothetical protein
MKALLTVPTVQLGFVDRATRRSPYERGRPQVVTRGGSAAASLPLRARVDRTVLRRGCPVTLGLLPTYKGYSATHGV